MLQDVLLIWKLIPSIEDRGVSQRIDGCNQKYLLHLVGEIMDFKGTKAGKDSVSIHVLKKRSRYYLVISLESKVSVWEYEEAQEVLHYVSLLDCTLAVPVEIDASLDWSADSSEQALLILTEGKLGLLFSDSKILDLNMASVDGFRLLVPSGSVPVKDDMKVVGIKDAWGSNVSLIFEDNSCLRFTICCLPLDRFLRRTILSQGEIRLSTLCPLKIAKNERTDEWKSYLAQQTSQLLSESSQNIPSYDILSRSDENA